MKGDKKLFTPGPLLTSETTKSAMMRDLGSRDPAFTSTIDTIKSGLLKVAGASEADWVAVLMQGSGTFSVEAVFQTAIPRDNATALILCNGAYGKRMMKICDAIGIPYDEVTGPEDWPVSKTEARKKLEANTYSLVAIVHCETSSGVLNDVESHAKQIRKLQPNASIFVDAMSSFGAIPFDIEKCDYLVSSANKCLEGVPGFGYAICRKSKLIQCKGNSRSLSLDLYDQEVNFEKTGQFRFTPATHTMLAFNQALTEFWKEGGVEGRGKRYAENRRILKNGLKKFGFKELVPEEHASYIITTYLCPTHRNFDFKSFYARLSERGIAIYPGKVTDAECFRIGNIGQLFPEDLHNLVKNVEKVLNLMSVPIPVTYN